MDGNTIVGEPDTLNGWKEIAGHLKKSVRTAQRWEAEIGLPVHRIPTPDGGQIVFADRREIDLWRHALAGAISADLDTIPSADTDAGERVDVSLSDVPAVEPEAVVTSRLRPTTLLVVLCALLAVLAIGEGVFIAVRLWPAAGVAERVEVLGREIRALTAAGDPVWTYTLDQPVHLALDLRGRHELRGDLDGDGRDEVVLAVSFGQTGLTFERTDAVLVFGDDGRLLRKIQFDGELVDGSQRFHGPWRVFGMSLSGRPGDRRLWIAYGHHTWWPSVVVESTLSGSNSIRYVQAGRIHVLAHWQSASGDYLVAGGMVRAMSMASVAFIPTDRELSPSLVSEINRLTCDGCPSSPPAAVVLLPPHEVALAMNRPYSWVYRVLTHGQRLTVSTDAGSGVAAIVSISSDFRVLALDHSDRYWQAHLSLEREGRLSHTADRCPDLLAAHEIRSWTPQDGWSTYSVQTTTRPPGSAKAGG